MAETIVAAAIAATITPPEPQAPSSSVPIVKPIEWHDTNRTIGGHLPRLIEMLSRESDVALIVLGDDGIKRAIGISRNAKNWQFASPKLKTQYLVVHRTNADGTVVFNGYQKAHYIINKLQSVLLSIRGEIIALVERPRFGGAAEWSSPELLTKVDTFLQQKKNFQLTFKLLPGEEDWVALGLSEGLPAYAPLRMELIAAPNTPTKWRMSHTTGAITGAAETSATASNLQQAAKTMLMDALRGWRVMVTSVDDAVACLAQAIEEVRVETTVATVPIEAM